MKRILSLFLTLTMGHTVITDILKKVKRTTTDSKELDRINQGIIIGLFFTVAGVLLIIFAPELIREFVSSL